MTTIAYRNIFETGTVTVDSEDADYPKENAYDWLPYPGDVWKPAASGTHYITVDAGADASADYFAVHAHDIDSVKLQYSNDNFSTDVNDVDIPAQNMLKYSEEFDNAAFIKVNTTVFPNAATAPDGTLTADKIISDGTIDPFLYQNYTVGVLASRTFTVSFYAWTDAGQPTESNLFIIAISGSPSESPNKTITLTTTPTLYDFTFTFDAAQTATQIMSRFDLVQNPTAGDYVYLWGAQLTETSKVQPYIKTTSATYPAIAPDGSKLIYREFTSLASRYWRFEVIKASAPSSVGVITLGEKLTIPESMRAGFSPANLARTNKYLNSTSDEGQFLGRRLISNGSSMNLSFNILTPEFARSSWDVFIQHAEVKPFFFAWNYDSYPTEVAFCWTTGKIKPPTYGSQTYMTASLKVKANT